MFTDVLTDDLDLRELFNSSANAYVIFTRDLVIAGCNDAYLRAVGRQSRAEIVGRPLFEAFPADPASEDYRILMGSLRRVLATNEADNIALIPYNTAPPGEAPVRRYWSATHTPLRNKRGEIAYILQHTVDVTELETLRQRDARANMDASGVLARAQAVQSVSERLSSEIGLLRELFDQAPGFIAVLNGPEHVFQLANEAYQHLVARDDLLGRSVAEALPEVVEQGFVAILDQVWQTGEPYLGRAVPVLLQGDVSQDGAVRYLDFIYQPILDGNHQIIGIFVQGHDVTEQVHAQRDLWQQTELMRVAQEGGGFGTYDWDLRKRTVRGSRLYRQMFGLEDMPEEIPVDTFMARVHADSMPYMAALVDEVSLDIEKPHEFKVTVDGRVVWVGARGTILRDADGRPERVLGAVQDLTQRKQIEERLDMVARESAHRVKNILTIMQIIIDNTLRRAPTLESARATLGDRVAALNQAQIRILAGPKESRLETVLRDTFAITYQLDDRVIIEVGDDVELPPRTSLGLALALHELITNAMKYGALSVPDGKVFIAWRADGLVDAGAVKVSLDWCEYGGPPVIVDNRKGFGSMLIRNSLTHDPAGRADWQATPVGVSCQFTFTGKLRAGAELELQG